MAHSTRSNQESENNREAGVQNQPATGGDNTVKNPDDWTTGNEEMTGAQHSYLKTLSDEAGAEVDESLTKAEASKRIDELQPKPAADWTGKNFAFRNQQPRSFGAFLCHRTP